MEINLNTGGAMVGTSIMEHFAPLIDPRIARRKAHQLLDIVVLAICAVVSGAEGWEAANLGQASLQRPQHNRVLVRQRER